MTIGVTGSRTASAVRATMAMATWPPAQAQLARMRTATRIAAATDDTLRVTVLKARPASPAGPGRGIQDQRLAAPVDSEVPQAVRSGSELTTGPARQPG